jgi:rod shape determining protein RodA
MFSEYNFKNFNFRLLFYALALNAIGLLVINSAVNGDRSYINRQLIGLFGGLVIMLFLALTDYHKLMRCTGVIYLGCVAILLAIIVAGQFGGAGTGARRWITLPVIGRFQPSEFVKIGLIIFFSCSEIRRRSIISAR